jgi:hypothetical protein
VHAGTLEDAVAHAADAPCPCLPRAHAADASDEYTSLSAEEISEVETVLNTSFKTMLEVFNSVSCEQDEQSCRLYGGVPGRTALLWNQASVAASLIYLM